MKEIQVYRNELEKNGLVFILNLSVTTENINMYFAAVTYHHSHSSCSIKTEI